MVLGVLFVMVNDNFDVYSDSFYDKLKEDLNWDGMRKVLIPLYKWFLLNKNLDSAGFLFRVYDNLKALLYWEDINNSPDVPYDLKKGIGVAAWAIEYVSNEHFTGIISREEILVRVKEALVLMEGIVYGNEKKS